MAVNESVITNGEMPDELRHELGREFYLLMKEGCDVSPLNVHPFRPRGSKLHRCGLLN